MVIGVDEVGRGALAGPLCVGAVVVYGKNNNKNKQDAIYYQNIFKNIKDSKKLSPQQRELWVSKIRASKSLGELDCTTTFVSANTIDRIGLAKVCDRAVSRVIQVLVKRASPEQKSSVQVLLDAGLRSPSRFDHRAIIKGDESEPVIAAASILAKVRRDTYMKKLAKEVPGYHFERNVGYGTHLHRKSIRQKGITEHHRRSWNIKIK
jgi:ribonuclease HII